MIDEQELQEQAGDSADGAEETTPDQDLVQLAKELEEVRQHALYAQAETQNVRRRLEQEK